MPNRYERIYSFFKFIFYLKVLILAGSIGHRDVAKRKKLDGAREIFWT
jgi:hypothetical protein